MNAPPIWVFIVALCRAGIGVPAPCQSRYPRLRPKTTGNITTSLRCLIFMLERVDESGTARVVFAAALACVPRLAVSPRARSAAREIPHAHASRFRDAELHAADCPTPQPRSCAASASGYDSDCARAACGVLTRAAM